MFKFIFSTIFYFGIIFNAYPASALEDLIRTNLYRNPFIGRFHRQNPNYRVLNTDGNRYIDLFSDIPYGDDQDDLFPYTNGFGGLYPADTEYKTNRDKINQPTDIFNDFPHPSLTLRAYRPQLLPSSKQSFQDFLKHFDHSWNQHFNIPVKVPEFDLDSLPDNYHNKTHDIHLTDDHHITVNQTVHKKADDGSRSVYHKKVIHIRPHMRTSKTPDLITPKFEPVSVTTQETTISPETTTQINFEGKLDENAKLKSEEKFVPFPDPFNRGQNPNNDLEKYVYELIPNNENGKRSNLKMRSLPSRYQESGEILLNDSPIKNSDNDEIEIFKPVGDEPPKDLSRDTHINRIHASNDGRHEDMILADPNSEIFNYPSVIESLKPLDE